jgi:hypothetical protein
LRLQSESEVDPTEDRPVESEEGIPEEEEVQVGSEAEASWPALANVLPHDVPGVPLVDAIPQDLRSVSPPVLPEHLRARRPRQLPAVAAAEVPDLPEWSGLPEAPSSSPLPTGILGETQFPRPRSFLAGLYHQPKEVL